MALNIKNPEVVRLAQQVAKLAGETKTEAIRRSLEERKERLKLKSGRGDLHRWLETEIWPTMPKHDFGKEISKEEEESILGYGEHGV
ncbi:MAG: type II toxin-antitoxin system VapB family antitoxin [Myxococcota bacterium]